MPGAYAHMTLANLMRETSRLEEIGGFPTEAITALLDWFEFAELGAVSPDYPYLSIGDDNAAKWADAMHYTHTGEMIRAGIGILREMGGEARRKGLAWLLGYASHVVADVTVHPAVELKVGAYAENKTQHRICEMNQDAYIFQRLNLGEVGLAAHLNSGIARCGDNTALNGVVRELWDAMMKTVHPGEYAANPPDINKWHRGFVRMLDLISHGNRLMPLARHVAVDVGLTYPAPDAIDRSYIDDFHAPNGLAGYDAIFEQALDNVRNLWGVVAAGVMSDDNRYVAQLGEWNLDTGRDGSGTLVFWS